MSKYAEIDFEHLNLYVGGDAGLTREVFGLFRNQVEMWGRMLTVDADDDTWMSVTHSLKGSARAVGAVNLAEICETAEAQVGSEATSGGRERAVQNIEHVISLVLTEIQRWEYDDQMNRLKA